MKYEFADRLAGIEVVAAAATDAYANPDALRQALTETARKLVADAGAEIVVLCGAAFSGMAAKLQGAVSVPLVDGVSCGVPLCEMLVRAGLRRPAATAVRVCRTCCTRRFTNSSSQMAFDAPLHCGKSLASSNAGSAILPIFSRARLWCIA